MWFVVCGALTVRIRSSDSARLVTSTPPYPCRLVRGNPWSTGCALTLAQPHSVTGHGGPARLEEPRVHGVANLAC